MLSKAYGADDYYDDDDDAGWWQILNADTFQYDPKLAKMFEVDIEKYPKNYRPGTHVGKCLPRSPRKRVCRSAHRSLWEAVTSNAAPSAEEMPKEEWRQSVWGRPVCVSVIHPSRFAIRRGRTMC